jgi:FG-GAP repeat
MQIETIIGMSPQRVFGGAMFKTSIVCLLMAGLTASAYAQICSPAPTGKLRALDGAASAELGTSVSISGDTAIVGSKNDRSGAGSMYVYAMADGVWTQQAKVVQSDGDVGDSFGTSLAIDGETAVVGSPFDSDLGLASGSAYVFTRTGTVWTQQAKLLPDGVSTFEMFGNSVSISGDTIVIGVQEDGDNGLSSGSAYVFTRSGNAWTQQAKLLPDDGVDFAKFGSSVSIHGETVVIGAKGDSGTGTAYVFTRSGGPGGVWSQQAKLLPADGLGVNFGNSVSIHGDTAVVGARFSSDNGAFSGSAYVYARSGGAGGVWSQQAKLLPDDGAAGGNFGISVSTSGDTTIVGADFGNTSGADSGRAYVFARVGGVWSQQAKIVPLDSVIDDLFGTSVSMSGTTTVAGATKDDDFGTDSGSAYVFDLGCDPCPVDLTGDGVLDFFDVAAFLSAFSAGCP